MLVLVCLVWPANLWATPDLLADRFSRGRLSPATPLPLPTTPLAVTDTTSTAPATPTPTGLPRVLTASTRGRPSSLPSPPSPLLVPVSSALAFLAPMTRSTTEEGTTRGRLSPAMPLPLPTTLLVAM